MIDKYKGTYRIPSARFAPHNYNEGTFFVTICTHERKHYFGNIIDEKMCLSKLGVYTEYCISQIPIINEHVILHSYVVMPNHIHLVISIQFPFAGEADSEKCECSPMSPSVEETPQCDVSTQMKRIAESCGNLSYIISRLKTAVTKYANKQHIPFRWQTRFHDHIIRDTGAFETIMNYVLTNVENWHKDCFLINSQM